MVFIPNDETEPACRETSAGPEHPSACRPVSVADDRTERAAWTARQVEPMGIFEKPCYGIAPASNSDRASG
jgi:hypothetical protein